MPAFYTHARFGKRVLEQLNPEIQSEIMKYPELYYIGLQGPDILFYYKAYMGNDINRRGFAQHGKPGIEFFGPARAIVSQAKNKEAAYSYIAGFICHFTLDSNCHPYIGTVEVKKGLSHAEIEAEEDRYLMLEDGKDCLRHLAVEDVVISDENAEVISWFFPPLTKHHIRRTLKDMKFFSRLFRAPSRMKRKLLAVALKAAGKYKTMYGMIINYEENQNCHESTMKIAELTEEAIPLAIQLIEEFYSAVENETLELHPRYQKTFGE